MSQEIEQSRAIVPEDSTQFPPAVENPARKNLQVTSTTMQTTRVGLDHVLGRSNVSAIAAIGIGEVIPAIEDEEKILKEREQRAKESQGIQVIRSPRGVSRRAFLAESVAIVGGSALSGVSLKDQLQKIGRYKKQIKEYETKNPPPYSVRQVSGAEDTIQTAAETIQSRATDIEEDSSSTLSTIRDIVSDPEVEKAEEIVAANDEYKTAESRSVHSPSDGWTNPSKLGFITGFVTAMEGTGFLGYSTIRAFRNIRRRSMPFSRDLKEQVIDVGVQQNS